MKFSQTFARTVTGGGLALGSDVSPVTNQGTPGTTPATYSPTDNLVKVVGNTSGSGFPFRHLAVCMIAPAGAAAQPVTVFFYEELSGHWILMEGPVSIPTSGIIFFDLPSAFNAADTSSTLFLLVNPGAAGAQPAGTYTFVVVPVITNYQGAQSAPTAGGGASGVSSAVTLQDPKGAQANIGQWQNQDANVFATLNGLLVDNVAQLWNGTNFDRWRDTSVTGAGNTVEQLAPVAEDNTNGVIATATKPLAIATYTPSVSFTIGGASAVVKASPGNIRSFSATNRSAGTLLWFQIFNSTTVPADTAVPVFEWPVAANNGFTEIGEDFFSSNGINLSTGISVALSTTARTKTQYSTGTDIDIFVTFK